MNSNLITTWKEANDILQAGYPSEDNLKRFPFAKYLRRLWRTDKGYQEHGPCVLGAMNKLLSGHPEGVLKGPADPDHVGNLTLTVANIRKLVGREERVNALFRIAALYHDIGKYIIKERHPVIGWYVIQYIDADERKNLRELLDDENDFRLLMTVLRDHDQFGVLSTGEASYPILLRAAISCESLEAQKRAVSALLLCNLADMAGTPSFQLGGKDTDKLAKDWDWFIRALEDCEKSGRRLDEHVIYEASKTTLVLERVRRLLVESSRDYEERRGELDNKNLLSDQFEFVFGSENAKREFAAQFTRVCKLDYGKRFFSALMDYCEGPRKKSGAVKQKRRLPHWSNKRMSSENVVYAVFALLRRITTAYAPMIQLDGGPGNLIGVELKDLTPDNAPEKTARIIDLMIKSHYPGLTWMMSDVPAWYF